MLVIGERFNSSIKPVENAIKSRDAKFFRTEAVRQVEAGADIIDINAGTRLKSESEDIIWVIDTIHDVPNLTSKIGIAIDSSDPTVIEAGLKRLQSIKTTRKPIVNSVTAEKEKLDAILPIVKKFDAQLVGLCLNEKGIPHRSSDRCKLGLEILETALDHQIVRADVYIDPLVLPIGTDTKNGILALDSIKMLKSDDPNILIVIGLSNISYGLPVKGLLNRTFLVMALAAGLDAAILNPLDTKLMNMLKAAKTLIGKDDYCMNYIAGYRNGEIKE